MTAENRLTALQHAFIHISLPLTDENYLLATEIASFLDERKDMQDLWLREQILSITRTQYREAYKFIVDQDIEEPS